MTEEQIDRLLAECLEDYHRERARGEVADLVAYREKLGDLHGEFLELIAAETAIDEALEMPGDTPLPLAWGAYTLLREIARGGAGVVYEAVHRKLGRKVALKVLRTGVDTDKNARERFRREAQALAQIRHDNVVEIYEFGELEGRPFYAMTLIEGATLADLVKRDERPDPREVCRGLAGVADALATLHAAGIIHRDVKPSNIMVDKSGRYMLADFGLARSAMSTTMTRTGDALGTPLYMSPQQIIGKRDAVEERADVYGLGATLYEMLTGRPPFKTDNYHALMRMVLKDRPASPRALVPTLPEGVSRIVLKCLEKEPQDRYESAAALRQDLLAFAEERRVAARPLSRTKRGLRWMQHNPPLTAAAALVAALILWMALKPEDPTELDFHSIPASVEAKLRIGDGRFMPLPVEDFHIEPGRYQATLHSDVAGFDKDKVIELEIHEGRNQITQPLGYSDPNHPNVVAAFLGRDSLPIPSGLLRRQRDVPQSLALELVAPRGDLRREDLPASWHALIDVDFLDLYPDGGHLVFLRGGESTGEPEELARVDFPPPDEHQESGPIPKKVLDAIRPGELITWGFVGPDGKPFHPVTFRLTAEDLHDELQTLDENLKPYELSKAEQAKLRPTMRAAVFLEHRLAQAAWDELVPVIYADYDLRGQSEDILRSKDDVTLTQAALAQRALEILYPDKDERELCTRWTQIRLLQNRWNSDEIWKFTAAAAKDENKPDEPESAQPGK